MKKIILLLGIALFFGCADVENGISRFIKENSPYVVELSDGEYTIEVLSQTDDYEDRKLLNEFVDVLKFVHVNTVPDCEKFYHVTVYIPTTVGWQLLREMSLGTLAANAFTVSYVVDDIYIVFNPEYWDTTTDKKLLKTTIHELMHHVSQEIYDDGDSDHSRAEFWGPNGLVNTLTYLFIKQETE